MWTIGTKNDWDILAKFSENKDAQYTELEDKTYEEIHRYSNWNYHCLQVPNILEKIFNKKLQLQSNKCHKIQVWNNFKCRMLHCRAEYHDSLQLKFFTSALLFGTCTTSDIPSFWKIGVNCRFNRSICKTWMWSHWTPLWTF